MYEFLVCVRVQQKGCLVNTPQAVFGVFSRVDFDFKQYHQSVLMFNATIYTFMITMSVPFVCAKQWCSIHNMNVITQVIKVKALFYFDLLRMGLGCNDNFCCLTGIIWRAGV